MVLAARLFPVAAWADTMVTLDEGMLTLLVSGNSTTDSLLRASGPDFAIVAPSGPLGLVGPHCPLFCAPGESFATRTSIFGAIQGGLTFAGVTYGVNDGSNAPGTAFVSWTAGGADIVLPPLGPAFTVMEPFAISITAALHDPGPVTRGLTASGGGVATFAFAPDSFGRWSFTSGSYLIETPEPATWLLVPTAVGLAWLARRKRKAT